MIDDRTKIQRLEKIISLYENNIFEVLYDKILYCNICKDILKDNVKHHLKQLFCIRCFNNYEKNKK